MLFRCVAFRDYNPGTIFQTWDFRIDKLSGIPGLQSIAIVTFRCKFLNFDIFLHLLHSVCRQLLIEFPASLFYGVSTGHIAQMGVKADVLQTEYFLSQVYLGIRETQ